jgi:hypothetical protein
MVIDIILQILKYFLKKFFCSIILEQKKEKFYELRILRSLYFV